MEANLPLIGLARERERVDEALRKRQPLLVVGPRGAGKTTVLRAALVARPDALYLTAARVPHELLASLAKRLGMDSSLSSLRLRGLLWSALEAAPRILILDGIGDTGYAVLRFLERLYHVPGMAIVVAVRDYLTLGALNRLFWDQRQTIQFEPLDDHEASLLFEAAADRFCLQALNLEEFRQQVLESACGNPGEIVEMCRLASNPRYVAGGRVKFGPLRIDTLMNLAGRAPTVRRI